MSAPVRIVLDSYSRAASENIKSERIKSVVKNDVELLKKFNFFGDQIHDLDIIMTETKQGYSAGNNVIKGSVSIERLAHLNCAVCRKYWSMSDLDPGWYTLACPHCQTPQYFEIEE